MALVSSAVEAGEYSFLPLSEDLRNIVARITYRASNVVISIQPALFVDSETTHHLKLLRKQKTTSFLSIDPEVCSMSLSMIEVDSLYRYKLSERMLILFFQHLDIFGMGNSYL
jgi:hypothetical protein